MRKKRFLAMVLAGMMTLGGCGNSGEIAEGQTVQDSGFVSETGESGDEDGTFTITMMQELFSDQAPDINNEWYQKMEEMTGVKMEVNFVPTLSYVDKITAFIASQSLPMVFTANTSVLKNNNLLMALDSDGFWALDDYIKEYPNLYEFVEEDIWENSKINGKIYGIPRLRILPRNGAIIRQDWLDNLGLEMPETFEELMEVARAFTEDDPDGNGKDDTVGIVTAYQGVGNRGWNGVQTLATAMGAPNGWAYKDGSMIPDFGTEEYLEALTYIKELYDAGYLNKDFAEINAETRYDYFDSGNYGIVFGMIDDIKGRNTNLKQVEPDAKLSILSALHEEGQNPIVNATSGSNGLIMFTKFGENAIQTEDELRRVLSYYDQLATEEIQDMTTYGMESVHYEEIDNVRTLIMSEDGSKTQLETDMGDIGQILMSAPYVRKDDDSEMLTTLYDTIEEREAFCVFDASNGLKSETYDELSSDLDKIMMDAAVKYITGTMDEAGYWKEYENWKSRGGNEVMEEFSAQYQEYKE